MTNSVVHYVNVTAAYSNAVLVALLPHFSDFAQRTELKTPVPIAAPHIREFRVNPTAGIVGGALTLTNGFRFWFGSGVVDSFHAPRDFFVAQVAETVPEFYGQLRMTENEAVLFAKETIKRLGYREVDVCQDWPMRVRGPFWVKTNCIPFYQIKWEAPDDTGFTQVSIDAEKREIVGVDLDTKRIRKPPPTIDVVPELLSDYRKRIQRESRALDTNASTADLLQLRLRPPVEPKQDE